VAGCPADEIWCLDRLSLRAVWKVDSQDEIVRSVLGGGAFASDGYRGATIRSCDDGQELWKLQGEARLHVLDGSSVLCSRGNAIQIRDRLTGEELRSVPCAGFVVGRVAGPLWVTQHRDGLAGVDVERGVEVWRRERWVVERREMVLDQRLFVTISDRDVFGTVASGVVRISGETGDVVWTASEEALGVGGQRWFAQTPPVVADPWVVIAGDLGEFVAMDATTGAIVSNRGRRLEKQLRGRPAISYKNRIAKCFEFGGGLAIYTAPEGDLVRFVEHKWPLWDLKEVDGRLFVSTGDGVLLVYDESIWGL